MLFTGIDWSDQDLEFELRTGDGEVLEAGEVETSPEGMVELFARLDRHAPAHQIAIAIEATRAAWIQSLLDHGYAVYPLHPASVDSFRKARSAAGHKSDKIDRRVIAMYLATFHADLRQLRPDDPEIVALRIACEDRLRLIEERTARLNELTALLKQYCPVFSGLFGVLNSRIALEFLQEFPTQDQMRQLSERKLQNWLKRHGYTHRSRLGKMIVQLQGPAMPVTGHHQAAKAPHLQFLARSLLSLNEEIDRRDRMINEQLNGLPEADWVRSLPGVGKVLGPAILAVIGRDPARFNSPEEAGGLVGTAPVTIASGRSKQVRFRRGCWKFARRTFQLLADQSRLAGCTWVVALYERLRAAKRGHHEALRVIANRWLKIILAMKRTGSRYDEALFLQSRARYLSKGKADPT